VTSKFIDDTKVLQSASSREHTARKPRSASSPRVFLSEAVNRKIEKMDHAIVGDDIAARILLEARTQQKGGRVRGARFARRALFKARP